MRGGNEWMGLTGNRDQWLVFKDVVEAVSKSGAVSQTFAEAFETYGSHRDLRGKERFSMGAEYAEAEAIFTIRYKSGTPKPSQVIEWDGKVFEVAGPPIALGNRQGWQIYAKIRRAD
jgi:head-tail adaptor